ncbi:DUF362 domain-containing protein [Acidobacteriota bacterium]
MSVFYQPIPDYDISSLEKAVDQALQGLNVDIPRGARVVLKPNLVIAASPEEGITTHPVFAEAVIRVLQSRGAQDVCLVEGPGIGEDAQRVFETTGFTQLSRTTGARLLCAEDLERVSLPWKYGEIEIPKIVLDCDLYMNLVKMKTHVQSRVTLCLKNQKGLLKQQDKKNFHYKWGLWEPVVALSEVIRPHLNLVDGILAMEGDGPTHRGTPKKAGAFLAGTDMVETELACLSVMGIPSGQVPYYRFISQSGSPSFIGHRPEGLDFAVPDLRVGRKRKVISYRNPWACSLCTAALGKSVKIAMRNPRYWFSFLPKFIYHAYFKGFDILQGKRFESIPYDELRFPVCFGKCTKEEAKRHGFPYIKGCPPEPSEIIRVLSRSMRWW